LVQHIPIDVIKGELGLVVVELEGHEPLPIIEELKVVFVGLEHSSPCFRTASACEVLDWAVFAANMFQAVVVSVDVEVDAIGLEDWKK